MMAPSAAMFLPREAITDILRHCCIRFVRVCLHSTPTDPPHLDEVIYMWIEDCALKGFLRHWRGEMIRTVSIELRFVSRHAISLVAVSRA